MIRLIKPEFLECIFPAHLCDARHSILIPLQRLIPSMSELPSLTINRYIARRYIMKIESEFTHAGFNDC